MGAESNIIFQKLGQMEAEIKSINQQLSKNNEELKAIQEHVNNIKIRWSKIGGAMLGVSLIFTFIAYITDVFSKAMRLINS